jgi:protein O-GlcNAc transferase
VAARFPFEPRLHETIGLSLLARGDAKTGAVELRKEIDYSGGSFVTYASLGRAELQIGDFGAAATDLENAAQLNPTDPGVTMQLADAYNRLGQYIKSCDVLSRVLAVDPGNMPLRFKFANSLYHAERYADALTQFTQLVTFDPKNADFLVNMGAVYVAMDSTKLAIEAWQKALKLDPTNEIAKQNLKAVKE